MFEDVPGLTVTAPPTVLAPGKTGTVRVRLDGADAEPGELVLDLALHTGVGRTPLVRVPLELAAQEALGRGGKAG
jgi:hypothetical protein